MTSDRQPPRVKDYTRHFKFALAYFSSVALHDPNGLSQFLLTFSDTEAHDLAHVYAMAAAQPDADPPAWG